MLSSKLQCQGGLSTVAKCLPKYQICHLDIRNSVARMQREREGLQEEKRDPFPSCNNFFCLPPLHNQIGEEDFADQQTQMLVYSGNASHMYPQKFVFWPIGYLLAHSNWHTARYREDHIMLIRASKLGYRFLSTCLWKGPDYKK